MTASPAPLSRSEIDAEYDVPRSVADPAPFRALQAARSAEALSLPGARLGVRFGPTEPETLDVYPACPGAPALLFLHGGYWRASSAREHAYAALGPRAHGLTVIALNYALCPAVELPEITRQCAAGAAWVWRNALELGVDRERLFVAGHSAGAQLAARLLERDRPLAPDVPVELLRAGIGLSGVYDLRPLQQSFLQPVLRLTEDVCAAESPGLALPQRSGPMHVTVGAQESREFRRQSRDYGRARAAAGLPGRFTEQPERNHYSIALDLADAESPLCLEMAAWAAEP